MNAAINARIVALRTFGRIAISYQHAQTIRATHCERSKVSGYAVILGVLTMSLLSMGICLASDPSSTSRPSVPRGFACLGTALPDEVYTAPIPAGWVERTMAEVDPAVARTINTVMPDLTAADRRRGYVLFVKNWGDQVIPQTAPLAAEMKDSIRTFASLGEYVAASFSVRALRPLRQVRVTVADLVDRAGHRMGSENVDVRVVRCLPTKVWSKKEYVIRPRILEKRDAMDIAEGRTQQFWLTVYVSASAVPGTYAARISVEPQDDEAGSLTLDLEVLPIHLEPSPARHYMYAYMFCRPLEHEIVLKNLVNMREHGMTGGYFATGYSPKLKREDGRIVVDIEALKGLLEVCRDVGLIDPFIYSPVVGADDWGDEGFGEILREIVRQVKEAGLPVPTLTFGDEDDVSPARTENTTRHLRLIKKNLPSIRIYANVVAPSSANVFDPWVDFRAFSSYADETSMAAMARKPGEEFWMYSGPSGYGMMPVEDRLYRGLYAHRMNLKGVGEWVYQIPAGMKAEPDDPWRDFTERGPHGNNWDYCLPAPDGPLPTPGWEGYREGINDGRYIATLESAMASAERSGDNATREVARLARDCVDRFLARIDLSPSQPIFGTRREAAKLTNGELDAFRRDVARYIVSLRKKGVESERN